MCLNRKLIYVIKLLNIIRLETAKSVWFLSSIFYSGWHKCFEFEVYDRNYIHHLYMKILKTHQLCTLLKILYSIKAKPFCSMWYKILLYKNTARKTLICFVPSLLHIFASKRPKAVVITNISHSIYPNTKSPPNHRLSPHGGV